MKIGFLEKKKRDWASIFYHVAVVIVSAAFCLSLPFLSSLVARNVLRYWSVIGNEKTFLVSLEIALAILTIFVFQFIRQTWKNRRLSNVARKAGLIFVFREMGFFARRKIRKLKERQGFARDVMIIGSTGFNTFVDPRGELHQVVRNCREAKIMLLNPHSEAAKACAKSLFDPDVSLRSIQEQIEESIDFLREIRSTNRNVKLKFYEDEPLLKLAVLGDYVWMQHYHAGVNVETMPKYMFKYDQNPGSLYIPFYQYFVTRWNAPAIPEYDFDADELVFRDEAGNERRRIRFEGADVQAGMASVFNPDSSSISGRRGPLSKGSYPLLPDGRVHVWREEFSKNL